MDAPLVSIVIASYGRAQLVARAVRSALAQTHPDVEVVVSDDASPDDTAAVLGAIADARLRVQVQPRNTGVWPNWTAALRMAKGEYVVFLGDDDYLTPNFVSSHLAAFARHPGVGVVVCPMEDRYLDGGLVGRGEPPVPADGELGPEDLAMALLRARVFFGAAMFRRELALNVWLETEPEGMVADWGLFLRGSLVHGMRAAACQEPTYQKTVHPKRLSSRVIEVTTLLAELCERISVLAKARHPALARRLERHAAGERITLARHHFAFTTPREGRRELWHSFRLCPSNPTVWSQILQSYLVPGRMIRTSRAQRGAVPRSGAS